MNLIKKYKKAIIRNVLIVAIFCKKNKKHKIIKTIDNTNKCMYNIKELQTKVL